MSKPIAVLCLSNWGGIAILSIDDREETVTYQWYDNEPETVSYDYKYDEETDEVEAYFIVGESKYYFHEFMRIGGY